MEDLEDEDKDEEEDKSKSPSHWFRIFLTYVTVLLQASFKSHQLLS